MVSPEEITSVVSLVQRGLSSNRPLARTGVPCQRGAMEKDTKPLALITGASRGLGAACAEVLAAKGYHVLAVARTTGALEELDDRIKTQGGSATLAPLDVTNADAMAHMCRSIHERWGGLALWVHTALHTAPLNPAQVLDGKDFDKSIETNIRALSRLIPFIDPLLRASSPPGTAVFFDDKADAKFAATYASAKAAQRALVQTWAAECTTPTSPKVKLLNPKPMATAHRARFYPGEDRNTLASPKDEALRLLPEIIA